MYDLDKAIALLHDLEKAIALLRSGEEIVSGLEASADNAGLDLEEVRHWWQKVKTFLETK